MKEDRFFLAPLEGVTNRTYRSCLYGYFPGLYASLTPFLPVPDGVNRVPMRALDQVAPPGTGPVPEIPQLLLSESSAFLKACRTLKKAGFREVNWNLGCPSRGVVRKSKGAGLLPHTSHILKVLDEIFEGTDLDVSLKLRLGMEQNSEIFRLLPRLDKYPLKRIILHPRLGAQMYGGSVDLDGFEKAMSLYGKAFCYNGDIRSLEDFILLKERFPDVNEWMIGRGILADPLLLDRLRKYGTEPESSSGCGTPHPFVSRKFLTFIDDLTEQLKNEFQKEISLWNFIKGILSYSFALEGTPSEMKLDLKRIANEKDWNLLRHKMEESCCQ